jgi:hypothetical protein
VARALRRADLGTLVLPALVGVSTLLYWLAGRRVHGLWIMPDEAIYAQRGYDLWRHGSLPLLHGVGAGYGELYPVIAGIPFVAGSFQHGYTSLKLLQALVVSLAAVPIFFYGRRLAGPRYALLAASLTVASPLLLYSGFVMTEVVFYPVAALALVATARAVETAGRRDQSIALAAIALAVLTRVQAIVLVAVFAAAIVVDALLARDRRRLRAFWPVWLLLVLAAIAAALAPGLFGSYAGTLRGSYPLQDAIGLASDHLAYLVLSVGVFPALALLLLLFRPPSPAVRALAAVAASAVVLVVVQVGLFAARFSPQLLGRDLASLPPILFLVLAVWLAHGAPRPLIRTIAAAFALLCLLLLTPWDRLVSLDALHDSFSLALLLNLHAKPVTVVTIAAPVALAAAVFIPRRVALVLPAAAFALLVASTVAASNDVSARAAADRANIVGPTPNWVDRAAGGAVTYVYAGEAYWNSVWLERFWNRDVEHVVTLAPSTVPGPMAQRQAGVPVDGRLPVDDHYVLAANELTFVGSPVAQLAQTGLDVSGLTLWELNEPARLSTVTHNVLPNGDMVRPATVDVYDCRSGSLDLTLLPKATQTLTVLLDGRPVLHADIGGQAVWHGSIPVPKSPTAARCRFTIEGGTLLGSTRIGFVR